MSPSVTVRFWAGARRAAGRDRDTIQAATLGDLIDSLSVDPELAKVCLASSFLVDEVAGDRDTVLREGSVVDVLPPFAGG